MPWQELAARTGAELRWLDLTGDGRIDPATADVITGRTRVVALTYASRVCYASFRLLRPSTLRLAW